MQVLWDDQINQTSSLYEARRREIKRQLWPSTLVLDEKITNSHDMWPFMMTISNLSQDVFDYIDQKLLPTRTWFDDQKSAYHLERKVTLSQIQPGSYVRPQAVFLIEVRVWAPDQDVIAWYMLNQKIENV
jgi:hypothetical protein